MQIANGWRAPLAICLSLERNVGVSLVDAVALVVALPWGKLCATVPTNGVLPSSG